MFVDHSTKPVLLSLVLLFFIVACQPKETTDDTGEVTEETSEAETQTLEEAAEFLEEAARAGRAALAEMSFEEFKATVYKEPFEGGKFIVNGDTTIVDEKHLREFYDNLLILDEEEEEAEPPPPGAAELIVHQAGNLDAVWNATMKGDLTYCVSSTFGDSYDAVVSRMAAAAGAWEAAADLDMRHDPSQDDNCTASNSEVVFDVRPVDVGGRYLARAFFPNEPRLARNVLIDGSSFELGPGNLTLEGILRHELGHALGFRHEHTRPDSGTCFEDTDWRELTDYDPFSVMHYPQCNGLGDWTLTLTDRDNNGAACLYGAAAGFTIDTEICEPEVEGTVTGGEPQTQTFTGQSVAKREQNRHGPFSVAAGSVFEASITGSGDPDLYVRFGVAPTPGKYNCRPFLFGADETCAVDVPAGEDQAHVMVRGYDEGTYDLTVTHTPPAE